MINGQTYSLGLIGWPVEQSLSPKIHSSALKATGLRGNYRLYPIPPQTDVQSELKRLFDAVRRSEITGLNLTVPYKISGIPLLDELTPAAAHIGAVNTIYINEGKLFGDNTDAEGFFADLEKKLPKGPKDNSALVLGAGGSSRAVCYALAKRNWQVIVAARRLEQAQQLVKDLKINRSLPIQSIQLTANQLKNIHPAVIINTTPVGMEPNNSSTPWPNEVRLPQGSLVYDLVYKPKETLLMKTARQSGLEAFNGLGMLVEQAALSFERWTGLRAPIDQMYTSIK